MLLAFGQNIKQNLYLSDHYPTARAIALLGACVHGWISSAVRSYVCSRSLECLSYSSEKTHSPLDWLHQSF